jgi:hypothetical protein
VTVQSEPTQQINKPPFDPRPYAWVAKHDPELKGTIDNAARLTSADPDRVAWHLWKESGFKQDVRGSSGEIGIGQIMPATARELDAGGRLDPFNEQDNVLMAAQYVAKNDALFGKNSPSSFAAYNGGPNGVHSAKAQAYAMSAFPGAKIKPSDFTGDGSTTPRGLVNAGVQGGPDAFFKYAVDTAPRGMPVSDVWRHAEAMLVGAFLQKGDIAGAQHARDFVLQMSHTGSNQYLMAAHQSLAAGDGVSAAQALAKAHAFFPDGTIGRFRSNGQQVYAERLDENNPSQRIGQPFNVTPDDVAGLLNQTTNPQEYLRTLNDQQNASANARLKLLHGQYYADLPSQHREAAQLRAGAQVESAQIHGQAQTQAAETRASATRDAAALRSLSSGKGDAQNASLSRQVDKEVGEKYNTLAQPDVGQERLAGLGAVYHDARMLGATPPEAEHVASGLHDKTLQLLKLTDGNYGVVKPGGKDQAPIGYISKALGDRLSGGAPTQALPTGPVGAGANTPMAPPANLAGQIPVSQSSALPVERQR